MTSNAAIKVDFSAKAPAHTQHDFAPGKMISFNTYLRPAPTYYYGNDIIEELAAMLHGIEHDKIFFVTNAVLKDFYWNEIAAAFARNCLVSECITIDDAEKDKRFANLERLCETLVEKFVTKGSIIIGFGGGCLTNIVGLASGLIFRGIRYIEIPTTFMSVTDSCLSNKQAVNGRYGKNQYGMYYAPMFIFGDTRFLKTESLSGRKSAIAEGIKNALINDASLLPYYEDVLDTDLDNMKPRTLTELGYNIICSKQEILRKDPSEKLFAMALEYGHTFGHAIEFFSGGSVPHGIAVAKGMCVAAEISNRLGFMSREEVNMHYHMFGDSLRIDLKIPESISVDDIMDTILADNKKTAKGVKYVVLEKIGACLNPDGDFQICVDTDLVRSVLRDHNASVDAILG
ncbi:MAG: 3-dehydroquinate synthase [Clostridiales Family XIII bacterium]|jgi:3-dehydroquinate synthetase|nr:3-dehydroquinate synthase [Clostridiales Family XIII bacterium]